MSAAIRQSPVHEALAHRRPEWGEISSMPVALSFKRSREDELFKRLALCDLSALERFGVTGTNAAEWLQRQGCELPQGINTWSGLQNGGRVARLGASEFFIEDAPEGSMVRELKGSLNSGAEGVRPIIRQDAAFALTGERSREMMLQVCGLDFDAEDYGEHPVFMTRVAGITAIVIPQTLNGTSVFRIWCDYPFGMYLWEELSAIVEEFGGEPIGVSAFLKEAGARVASG